MVDFLPTAVSAAMYNDIVNSDHIKYYPIKKSPRVHSSS